MCETVQLINNTEVLTVTKQLSPEASRTICGFKTVSMFCPFQKFFSSIGNCCKEGTGVWGGKENASGGGGEN